MVFEEPGPPTRAHLKRDLPPLDLSSHFQTDLEALPGFSAQHGPRTWQGALA